MVRFISRAAAFAAFAIGAPMAGASAQQSQTYQIDFAWQATLANQAYDARDPAPIGGWTRRMIDFENRIVHEELIQCYPGLISFHNERVVGDAGGWFRDVDGWALGDAVTAFEDSFEANVGRMMANSLFVRDHAAGGRDTGMAEAADGSVSLQTEALRSTFSDIETAGGVRYARRAEILPTGASIATVRTTLAFNADVAPLSLPDWTQRAGPTGPQPIAVEQLADGVQLVRNVAGDRNIIAVMSDSGWIVIGAPVSAEATQAAHEALAEATGERRIAAATVTHIHGDHSGGLGYFAGLGARIVISEAMAAQFAHLDAPWLADASVTRFSGVHAVAGATTQLELHEVPNRHSLGLFVAWLPEHGIVYEGDLMAVPNDGTIRAAMQPARDMAAYFERAGISFRRLIGHHQNGNVTPEMFAAMLANDPRSNRATAVCKALGFEG